MSIEDLVRAGELAGALEEAKNQVRKNPAKPEPRICLFQLMSILGDWERAMTQLGVAADLDADSALMAQLCGPAVNCEVLRAEVFAGKRSPLIFGEPAEWIASLCQAVQLLADGQTQAAAELRDKAFEEAPATGGTVNDQPFEWIADADSRLGPVLEAVVEGRYYWVPFANIRQVVFDEPKDLRDMIWIPGFFTWANGGNAVGLVPVRYAGTEQADDAALRLARKTEWKDEGSDFFRGLGQRMLTTNQGDYPLLEVRKLVLGVPEEDTIPAPAPADEEASATESDTDG